MIDAIKTIGAALSTATESTTSATGSAASIASQALGGAAPAGQSFSDVFSGMASEMTNSLRSAETASIQGISGKANTREVIDAVMSAEQSLQTAIAIRDKIVTAYLEIARTPI
ncbi:flagellar hook-basal body protein FliE [Rhizobium sp. Leaf384]|uniref:flagellar hook-basal body complex protein FliE n=2 Tax=Rhizobium TaxID=379 RepID=UPI0007129236|nr:MULTISPECIES: flagellar hook-basal body complex protein FliE [unclassified Rhizobium]KQS80967.1 flagellar hook-basal body protein FliE [Rhizobium sp. Leaf384]KQS86827.1 flagellar hook-basal body protein FliE [Rhizobium sp. Leaf383]